MYSGVKGDVDLIVGCVSGGKGMSTLDESDLHELKRLLWLFITAFYKEIGERLSFKKLLNDSVYLDEVLLVAEGLEIDILQPYIIQIRKIVKQGEAYIVAMPAEEKKKAARLVEEVKHNHALEEKYKGRLR
jgi:hypothetical protein